MKIRKGFVVIVLIVTAVAYGQESMDTCAAELMKSEGDNRRVRVSTGVAKAFAQKEVLPDVSDLKGSKTDSIVLVKLLIGKDGTVGCADATQGDTSLFHRSAEAAKQWRFKPYLLNGEPVIVETQIEFAYKKDKVSVPNAKR